MASPAPTTASPDEIARFQALADEWWDAEGKLKPLHQMNPPRLAFMRDKLAAHFARRGDRPFAGLTLLDVGCGGGLLSEPMARLGFAVTGIDAAESSIAIARRHAEGGELTIDYRCALPEQIEGEFDVVLAMEVVEHVPSVDVFFSAVAERLTAGGAFVGATLNRTAKSYAMAIVGAEYVLGWLPRGTHAWRKFLRPSEFAALLRRNGIRPAAFEGVRYAPWRDRWDRCQSLDVNYMVYGVKG
jgi:2-polyprenyl-6-hydroxyphenyl methylase/3-demethylubiquinone-9 3-methyltransferase